MNDRRILVPLTGSSHAHEALERALATFPTDDVTVLRVITPFDEYLYGGGVIDVTESRREEVLDDASRAVESTLDRATADGVEFTGELETTTVTGRPVPRILEYAAVHDVDHIVLGDHDRGPLQGLVGGTPTSVTRRASIPVTIVE
jgi:nucleotide-binding universal stress UspA family protein